VLVALNMSGQEKKMKFDLSGQGIAASKGQLLLSSPAAAREDVSLTSLTIPAFGVVIAEVK